MKALDLTHLWLRRGPLACLLWPVSWLFGRLVQLRQRLYQWGWLSVHRLPVPVIVVGNVMVGGVGKTPIVMALVEHLQQQGFKVGVISRGYGRTQPELVLEVLPTSPATAVGDEPLLIAQRCQVPVWVGARRVAAAQALLSHHPDIQVLVCDDGLQHLSLARDIELCVFDERGTGNGWLLPAGPLREPWPRQGLAPGVTQLTLCTAPDTRLTDGLTHGVQRRLADQAHQADGTQRLLSHWHGQPVQALAGIAKPDVFFAMLAAQGLTLGRTLALPDHADLQGVDVDLRQGDLLCTEKDAVKLWATVPQAWAVPLLTTLPPALLDAVTQALQNRDR